MTLVSRNLIRCYVVVSIAALISLDLIDFRVLRNVEPGPYRTGSPSRSLHRTSQQQPQRFCLGRPGPGIHTLTGSISSSGSPCPAHARQRDHGRGTESSRGTPEPHMIGHFQRDHTHTALLVPRWKLLSQEDDFVSVGWRKGISWIINDNVIKADVDNVAFNQFIGEFESLHRFILCCKLYFGFFSLNYVTNDLS